MVINLTLFVQIIHFWIAYLILDRILLRSALQLVRHEQLDAQQRKDAVAALGAHVAAQQQEKERTWKSMQHTLLQRSVWKPVI